jgi:16S rRNA (guanine966-N2)-methyltransferase
MTQHPNSVRIIAGKWRGRRLSFPSVLGLRPTPDRVRETVFNWLQPVIVDAVCLDLFAGSGAFGFEALSRGAKKVVMVDNDSSVIQQLHTQAASLQASITLLKADIAKQWPAFENKFDVVFLDPPYQSSLLEKCLQQLPAWLLPQAVVYVETSSQKPLPPLPSGLEIIKEKKAGQVAYYLLQKNYF